ncbi:hypothetical protein [Streptomyces apocyni]|uniref:hypothetical protein n=1 Tax=Streptomyces apocyni TaxID=2654677 RepID=UPI0012EAB83D|nr:hypothetical protein [Streptomyces apocyni]
MPALALQAVQDVVQGVANLGTCEPGGTDRHPNVGYSPVGWPERPSPDVDTADRHGIAAESAGNRSAPEPRRHHHDGDQAQE